MSHNRAYHLFKLSDGGVELYFWIIMIKQSVCLVLCFTAFLELGISLRVPFLIGTVQDTDCNDSVLAKGKFTTELVELGSVGEED